MEQELNEVKFTIQYNNLERTNLLTECNKQSIAYKKNLSVKEKLKSLKV